ncbi:hypothetical protein QBC47DRAFT_222571 [Echria macrotheca]|uniref:Uncharacterized protein n=1 Tax=Echria macrotheca TaxID=438768 RepID=A0AAJ0F4H9_9PEZI|nr:hypothetical protein QBC47DRAFT_222571 [Echria macrotheca]
MSYSQAFLHLRLLLNSQSSMLYNPPRLVSGTKKSSQSTMVTHGGPLFSPFSQCPYYLNLDFWSRENLTALFNIRASGSLFFIFCSLPFSSPPFPFPCHLTLSVLYAIFHRTDSSGPGLSPHGLTWDTWIPIRDPKPNIPDPSETPGITQLLPFMPERLSLDTRSNFQHQVILLHRFAQAVPENPVVLNDPGKQLYPSTATRCVLPLPSSIPLLNHTTYHPPSKTVTRERKS